MYFTKKGNALESTWLKWEAGKKLNVSWFLWNPYQNDVLIQNEIAKKLGQNLNFLEYVLTIKSLSLQTLKELSKF